MCECVAIREIACVRKLAGGPLAPGLFYRGLSTMRSLGYVLLFTALQAVALLLAIAGVPIVGFLAVFKLWTVVVRDKRAEDGWLRYDWRGGKLTWLWGNDEDGVFGPLPIKGNPRIQAFYWSALRNSVNNFRFVPGVSKVGRPLFYRTWFTRGKQFYFKAGWMSDGYPCLSAGAGRGF